MISPVDVSMMRAVMATFAFKYRREIPQMLSREIRRRALRARRAAERAAMTVKDGVTDTILAPLVRAWHKDGIEIVERLLRLDHRDRQDRLVGVFPVVGAAIHHGADRAEAAAAFALDHFVEERRTILHGSGEDLQHIPFIVAVH